MERICIVCHRVFPKDIMECPEDRVRLTERDARIGTFFDGKYEILDYIGAGGLSRVYKARHKELNRIMALKVLKSTELIDLQRFRREAISVSTLEHPNIARVFAFAAAPDGAPYMALEYLEGRDLSEWIAREGPLSEMQAIIVFDQVAAALEHAHSRKIIHRDIKPSNIILLSDPGEPNNVKVVDFGMAKILDEESFSQKLTLDGEVFGTLQYISPEQYRGIPADERADIYSLGISMYECVRKEGKPPESLAALISRATQSDPAVRIQSASQLREELRLLRDTLDPSGSYSGSKDEQKRSKDVFGTFYFWTMLIGMLIVGVCATIVVKQRMHALESVAQHSQKQISRMIPLSFAAVKTQAAELTEAGKINDAIKLLNDWLNRQANSGKWEELCEGELYSSILSTRIDYEQAFRSAQAALDLAKKHNIQGKTYTEILTLTSGIEYRRKNYQSAIDYAQKALALCKDGKTEDDLSTQAACYYSIARCQLMLENLDEAETAARKGLDLTLKFASESQPIYGEGQEILARIYAARKQYDKAFDSISTAVECFNQKLYRFAQMEALAVKASIAQELGMKNEVEAVYRVLKKQLRKGPCSNPEAQKMLQIEMSNLADYLGKQEDFKTWQSSRPKD